MKRLEVNMDWILAYTMGRAYSSTNMVKFSGSEEEAKTFLEQEIEKDIEMIGGKESVIYRDAIREVRNKEREVVELIGYFETFDEYEFHYRMQRFDKMKTERGKLIWA